MGKTHGFPGLRGRTGGKCHITYIIGRCGDVPRPGRQRFSLRKFSYLLEQSAFRVKAADTTGAGSAFRGAFAFGYAQGWPLPRIAEFSCAVAGLACQSLGARTSLPTLKDVERLLSARSRDAEYLEELL